MRWLLIALLLLPGIASAQNHFCGKQVITGSGGGIEYPLDTSGLFNTSGAKFWVDFSQDPSSSPITDGTGNYQFVVNSTPVRDNDGTYPAGLSGTEGYAWYLDAAEGATRANDGSLNPDTQYTLVAVHTAMQVGTDSFFLKKRTTVGYQFYINTNDVTLFSDTTFFQKVNIVSVGGINCIVATLDGTGGSGSSDAYIYVDEYTAASSSTMDPSSSNTGDMIISSNSTGEGRLHYVAYYPDTIWTDAQARSFCRNFYGLNSDQGTSVSITSSAPPASLLSTSGDPSTLVSTSPDSAIVGAHGLYIHPGVDNLIQRQSFESWPTWDTSTTAGDGSAAIAQDSTGAAVHGLSFIKMTLTGTTSAAEARSACITTGISSDLYVQAMLKKGSGTTQAAIKIHEYSDASCTSSIGTTDIVAATDVTTSWDEYSGQFAAASWNGSTAGYEIELHETCNGGCDSHWDAIQAASRSTKTSAWCVTCDTDATCSCTKTQATIPQPLSPGGWKISATVRMDHASSTKTGSTTGVLYYVPGTVGNNNSTQLIWQGNSIFFTVYDSSGVSKQASVSATGSADTDYLIEAYHYADGDIKVCLDGSCGSTVTGAVMDGISSTFQFGYLGSFVGDWWVRNFKVEDL